MTLAPSTKLGPYEILSPISAGGMGEVWKARDTRLDRIVAINKVKEQHSESYKRTYRLELNGKTIVIAPSQTGVVAHGNGTNTRLYGCSTRH